jgi:L-amino acid N-acyltransferase YncA
MQMQIDLMTPADWLEVSRNYEGGIATGLATFETQLPSWDEWDAARLSHSRLVARGGRVLGWATLSFVSKRPCYIGVAEVAIYVSTLMGGCGVGRALLEALIESSEAHGVWTLQAATIAKNFESLGSRQNAAFELLADVSESASLATFGEIRS